MKTIQCAHLPHHHNGFVATCRLWTASGGVLINIYIYIYIFTHHTHIYISLYIYAYIYIRGSFGNYVNNTCCITK